LGIFPVINAVARSNSTIDKKTNGHCSKKNNFAFQIICMKSILLPFAAILMLLTACETKIDLTGEYEDTTVVFGLIDLSAPKQVFRINKTFLGDEDAFVMAQVPDSSEYNIGDVEAWLEFGNNLRVDLLPEYVPQRQPGAFYDTNVLVYTTTENLAVTNTGTPVDLTASNISGLVSEYRLYVKVKGELVESTTVPVVLKLSNISEPIADVGGSTFDSDLKWVAPGGNVYYLRNMKHTTVAGGARYERKIIFKYREYYLNGDPADKTIEFPLGSASVSPTGPIQEFALPYNPETILALIANSLSCDGNVSYRSYTSVDFQLAVAGEDLATYMAVNAPLTGVVTERPEYTNIINGLGIFSSRYTIVRSKQLHTDTEIALYTGPYTGDLCFCDPSPGSSYPCPVGTACTCE
jgi:hypothetical protein